MDFGLMTEPQLGMTYDELAGAARFAERIGLSVFARSDHYDFPAFEGPHATDALATLAGLARDTRSIQLCVMVSPITFRHPGVIAKTAATIDEMSHGRLLLGVGTGWMPEEHELLGMDFPELGERFDRFEEALQYLRAAFGPGDGGFSGDYYTLAARPLRPKPSGIEIVVGGGGARRTPRLAGTYADEFNVFTAPPAEMAERIERARSAAGAAGRDPSALRISIMGPAVVGTDESSYRSNLERIAAAHPFGRSAAEIESRLLQQGLPVGTGAPVREAVAALEAGGVDRFYVQHFGPFDEDLMEDLFAALRG
ncbi:MAG: LLM class flavin-dependent oxidoreductase [Actinobacteria bacterium]|nr:LLM class flavin-dependent oxidoreductase [Actinomycetota bacterium]MBU1494017.1 LLM class flavin-dependent oxidoreductase [Actinomycetota bacterium]MBU1866460.1 LLM class flavin-dependent oxidoreductase [Actinomycetota bacterium]